MCTCLFFTWQINSAAAAAAAAAARPVRLSSVTSVIRTQATELFADIFSTIYIA